MNVPLLRAVALMLPTPAQLKRQLLTVLALVGVSPAVERNCYTEPSLPSCHYLRFLGRYNPATTFSSQCGSGLTAGDPVNCATGNLSETVTDLRLNGRGRYLSLDRTYNSLNAALLGPFGYGWISSYNMGLGFGVGSITVSEEEGETVYFTGSSPYTAPAGVTAALVKNSNGTYTFTLKDQRSDTFNASGVLISETDRNGYVTTIAHNSSNQITTVTDPAGRTLTFSYNSNGQISSVVDSAGRTVTYNYDTNKNLTSVVDVNGGTTSYTYDSNHHLLTRTNPAGGVTTNVFTSGGQVTSQTDPVGRVTTWSYSSGTTTVTDPNKNVRVMQFSSDLLTSQVDGSGTSGAATTSYTYDSNQNRTGITDGNGNAWSATYDKFGNRLSLTDPLSRTRSTVYNSLNDPSSATDALGVTTTFTYDSHGNLTTVSRPLGMAIATWTLTLGDATHPGDVTGYTDAGGDTTTFTYDTYGDTITRTDPSGDEWTYTYNNLSFLTSSVSPRGNVSGGDPAAFTTAYTSNNFGDVTQIKDPPGFTDQFTYDGDRNLLTFTDKNGHTTTYGYDLADERLTITRADGSVLKNSYDGVGHLASQTDGLGHVTSYQYNSLNQLSGITDPLSRVTMYTYDKAGNLATKTDAAGNVTTYTYDIADEPTGITYSDGITPNVTFAYDLDGQRTSMTDGSGTSSFEYDSLHRLTNYTSGKGRKVAYAYDLRSLPTTITYPNNKNVTMTYDLSGRLATVADWLGNTTSFAYDSDSNLTGETYPNSWSGTFQFDDDDRLTQIAYVSGTQTLTDAYTRDNSGKVLKETVTSTVGLSGAKTNVYDTINRLTSGAGGTFGYDAGDHLTSISTGKASLTYDVADELLTFLQSGATTSYTYDARGNRIVQTPPTGSAINLTYDQERRLTAYSTNAKYAYDGDGLRVSKTVGATTQTFVWSHQGPIPHLLQAGSSYYIYGPGGWPLEQITGTTALFYHHDQLGSTQMLTNQTGGVGATYSYNAYGKIVTKTGTVVNPFLFASAYTDSESGFEYLRARYYDPATSQFLTRDPLFVSTREPYVYAHDDPKNRIDITGLDCSVANPFDPSEPEFLAWELVGPVDLVQMEKEFVTSINSIINVLQSPIDVPGLLNFPENPENDEPSDQNVALISATKGGMNVADDTGNEVALICSGKGGVNVALDDTDVAAIFSSKGGVNVAGVDSSEIAIISISKGGVNAASTLTTEGVSPTGDVNTDALDDTDID
jgi:RHS repeat-associated protein